MIDLGKKHYPIFPIKLLLKDKYESEKKIKNLKSPLLVIMERKIRLYHFIWEKNI
ncbi:MAG: hypothetical protein Ct9H300mP5_0720 [Candidatus Pelagibacterales bacterium]|nr:MAG: hypothetical protein Ct9H300mP5_0720 [Pelagibacterales bacterium]